MFLAGSLHVAVSRKITLIACNFTGHNVRQKDDRWDIVLLQLSAWVRNKGCNGTTILNLYWYYLDLQQKYLKTNLGYSNGIFDLEIREDLDEMGEWH